jgi:cell shape-determining protein MreC
MRSFLASDEENESRFLWDSVFTLILLGVCVALLVADVRQHPVAGQARSTLLYYSVPVLQAIALPIEGIAFSTQQLNNLVHLRRENDALRAEVERLRNWFFAVSYTHLRAHET